MVPKTFSLEPGDPLKQILLEVKMCSHKSKAVVFVFGQVMVLQSGRSSFTSYNVGKAHSERRQQIPRLSDNFDTIAVEKGYQLTAQIFTPSAHSAHLGF